MFSRLKARSLTSKVPPAVRVRRRNFLMSRVSMVSENDAPIDVKPRVRFPRLSSEGPRILRELRSV